MKACTIFPYSNSQTGAPFPDMLFPCRLTVNFFRFPRLADGLHLLQIESFENARDKHLNCQRNATKYWSQQVKPPDTSSTEASVVADRPLDPLSVALCRIPMRLNPVVRVLPGTNSISRPQMPFTFGTYDYQRQQVTSGRRELPIKNGVAGTVSPGLGRGKLKWKTAVRQYNCFLDCITEASKTSCSCSVLENFPAAPDIFFWIIYLVLLLFSSYVLFRLSLFFFCWRLFHFYYSALMATSQQGLNLSRIGVRLSEYPL